MSDAVDNNWNNAKGNITWAAQKAGVDPGLLAEISGLESKYNPDARPIVTSHPERNKIPMFDGVKAISSAYGYGQFTDETWIGMVRQHGEKYGVQNASNLTDDQANSPALRQNVALQAGMLAEFTKQNVDLAAGKGGKDAGANVYAMHNLGSGEGAIFLGAVSSNPNAKVNTVLSEKTIANNPALYKDGTLTVAAAYSAMGGYMAQYENYAKDARQIKPSLDAPQPIVAPPATGAPSKHHTHAGHAHAAAHPHAEGVLQQGDRSEAVGELQGQLRDLGYKDHNGNPINPDNSFGNDTKSALQKFQANNGLEQDGIAGPNTLKALREQDQALSNNRGPYADPAKALRFDDPAHPGNELFKQAQVKVYELDAKIGRAPDARSDNLAGVATTAALAAGMTRIDFVLPDTKDGSTMFVAQNTSPLKTLAEMPTMQAMNTPLEQSSAQYLQVAQQQQVQVQAQAQLQTQNQASQVPQGPQTGGPGR